eukprot:TCALIF_02724-PA protein Name:"Similar to Tre1 Protein trapped in endoderm-1 (Drosophila melanogaster)" AED:0.18 eAED:0.19 QI:0/0.12/0/0.77/1/1/9/0/1136
MTKLPRQRTGAYITWKQLPFGYLKKVMISSCVELSDGIVVFDETSSTIAASFAVICAVFGIIGNASALVTLLGSNFLRQHSTTPFLVSLSISDLIFSFFNLPLLAHRFFTRDRTLGEVACVIFPFFFYSNVGVSSLSMMLISINRFVGIYFRRNLDRLFSRCRGVTCVISIWIFSFVAMSLPIVGIGGHYGYVEETFSCTFLHNNDTLAWLHVYSTIFVLAPCLVILISYFAILRKVCSTGNAMRSSITNPGRKPNFHRKSQTRERELTKTFFIICTCYVICFIPGSVLMAVDPMPPCHNNPGWHVFGYVMFWCSTIINPIVYILANRHYRKFTIYKVRGLLGMQSEELKTTSQYSPSLTSKAAVRFRLKIYPILAQDRRIRISDEALPLKQQTIFRSASTTAHIDETTDHEGSSTASPDPIEALGALWSKALPDIKEKASKIECQGDKLLLLPLYDEVSSQFAAWSAAICCVFGIVGNATTLFVLMKTRSLRRHPTTPFLVSLAFSDLIFSIFNLPLLAHRFFHRDWTLSYKACVAFPFFMYSNVGVSSLSMMLISLNRFVGIFYPNKMDKIFTQVKSWLSVICLWIFSFTVLSLPLAEVWGQYGYVKATFSCTLLEKNGHTPLIFFSLIFVGIPCTVMIISYSFILYKVRATGRAIRNFSQSTDAGLDQSSSVGHMTRTREKDLTKTFAIVCSCYIVSFIPVSILSIFDPMPPCYKNPGWHVMGYVMFWCSAIVNPIVYIFANRHYRKHFYYCIQRLLCMNPEKPTSSTVYSPTFTPQSTTRSRRKEFPSLPRERRHVPEFNGQDSLEMEVLNPPRETPEHLQMWQQMNPPRQTTTFYIMVDREESPLYDEVTSKVAAWSAVIFCALGILGNATALFVLIKNKSLRHHPTTPYLISLTLMDLIFSGFNLPLSAHRFFHHGWSLGDEACAAFQFVMNCRVAVSSLSMMVLSFNRFLVLYFPVSLATFFSRRQSSLCVLGLWVVSLAVPGLLAFFQNDSHHANLSDCTSIMNKEHSALISDPFALFVGISCLVMAISCCSIICKVWASGFFQTTDTGLRQDRSVGQINRSRERDLSKTIVIIPPRQIAIRSSSADYEASSTAQVRQQTDQILKSKRPLTRQYMNERQSSNSGDRNQ